MYNANVLDVVLHVIKCRCHCPRQCLTRNHIHANVPRHDVVLHDNTYQNPMS
ncbi:hypothetical protein F383_08160 [Gossypium arboreum]|uniref:Uncharacterized protein n=1 Tax=Gossypium arboreum TaxID=29729 RepID=A0A0B0PR41_GOSAR|nr:hypothetical protein F383_08160 [Gossypium arboreum]